MRPVVDHLLCVGCGACEAVCPAEPCVFLVDEKSQVIHPEACMECGACVDACPVSAIKLVETAQQMPVRTVP